MILRRVIAHFRKQEWTAIALDFLIVVVGVFVGLQVNNWNDDRNSQAREKAYLIALKQDVVAINESLDRPRAIAAGLQDSMISVLRAIETCSPESATREDFDRTFTQYQNTVGFQVRDATYNEMLSSGALAALEDDDLKKSIAGFFTEIENFHRNVPRIRDSLAVVDLIIWERVQLSTDATGKPVLMEYDLTELCQDRELINAMVEVIDMQKDWQTVSMAIVDRSVELDALLEKHLGAAALKNRTRQ
ncbi:hypothetical protein [Hyphococcus sp.]|uniref:hypothetical protein n=1 Tax=Hyphococcus sp. TaxID=2038636 RepID=UPI00208340BB|nr:MAG: hypothetical protein DHS20C04_10130 [Marinicaulis sp.]